MQDENLEQEIQEEHTNSSPDNTIKTLKVEKVKKIFWVIFEVLSMLSLIIGVVYFFILVVGAAINHNDLGKAIGIILFIIIALSTFGLALVFGFIALIIRLTMKATGTKFQKVFSIISVVLPIVLTITFFVLVRFI